MIAPPMQRGLAARVALCGALIAAAVALCQSPSKRPAKARLRRNGYRCMTPVCGWWPGRRRAIAKAYLAGIEVELAEGWKTYWRMPGDAGVPPMFDWSKSTNTAAIRFSIRHPCAWKRPAAQTIGYKGPSCSRWR